jgi:hypothetical protein
MPGKRQDSAAPTPITENSTNEPKDGQDREDLTTKCWRRATSVTFAQNGPNEPSRQNGRKEIAAGKSSKRTQPPKWQRGDRDPWARRDFRTGVSRESGSPELRSRGGGTIPQSPHFAGAPSRGLTHPGPDAYILGNYNLVRILSRVAEGRARRRHSNRFAITANAGANSRPAYLHRHRDRPSPIRAGRVAPMGQIRWSSASGPSAGAVTLLISPILTDVGPKTLDRNHGAPGRHPGSLAAPWARSFRGPSRPRGD